MNLVLIVINLFFVLSIGRASSSIELVSSSKGTIEAGNYTYYYINEKGTFKLVLISLKGDCDLYVSDKHRLVTFENYDYQSITYGNDILWLTEDMKRPISIGVYAHPYYVDSTFVLNKYKITFDSNSGNNDYSHISEENNDLNNKYDEDQFESNNRDQYGDDGHNKNNENKNRDSGDDWYEDASGNGDDDDGGGQSFLWSLFLHLIQILDIFL